MPGFFNQLPGGYWDISRPVPNVTKLSLHSEIEVKINSKHEARNSKQIQNSKAQNSKQKQFSPEHQEVTGGGFCFGHLFF
jgi:YbbR domain-containing protein